MVNTAQFDKKRLLQNWIGLLLYYTILVILWGAWVRISHSGDGCGDSWPLCEGKLIPDATRPKTFVELSHRLMSGLFGIFVLVGFFQTRILFPAKSAARFWAGAALILTITEALLGAKLVIFGLVGTNASTFRSFAMGLHFVNSALLVGSICYWSMSADPFWVRTKRTEWGALTLTAVRRMRVGVLIAMLLLGVTGTIAALSTTLFPSDSLLAGFAADLQKETHFLLRWRISHPALGLMFGSLGTVLFFVLARAVPVEFRWLRWRAYRVSFLFLAAAVIGTITLFLLSPTFLKLTHLALAHALWIALIVWLHGFFYEPSGAQDKRPILFFDGVCHLCHRSVLTLLKFDANRLFRFAPLQGETARKNLPPGMTTQLNSLVFWQDGKTYTKSDAVIACLKQCPLELRIFGNIAVMIPRFIRDAVYNWVARNRYAWFGEMETCRLPSPEEKVEQARFID